MPAQRAVIGGGGITGVAAALALTRYSGISCSIFEIRSEPATIGGAIGLTPKALRYLDHLGVLTRLQPLGCEVKKIEVLSHRTGKQLGTVDFDDVDRFKYRGLRVMRHQLLDAMLTSLAELGVQVQYDMRISSVQQTSDGMTAIFEDGSEVTGDFVLGCDGIHSTIRSKFLQPDRQPRYTGIANMYGFVDASMIPSPIALESTSLYFSRHGSLLMSYVDLTKSRLYVSAVIAADDAGSREGWIAKSQEYKALQDDLMRRFSTRLLPFIGDSIRCLENITLYPVYSLPEHGTWYSENMLLLGDAAHAMPPQGESVGLALEDVILLSRILQHRDKVPISALFRRYNDLRKPTIDAAVKEANFGFETIQDRGWFGAFIMEWLTWLVLLYRRPRKQDEFASDIREVSLSM